MAEAVLRSNVMFYGPGPGGPGPGGHGPHGGPPGGPPGGPMGGSGGIGTGGFMGRAFTFAAFHPHPQGGDGGDKDPKKPGLLERIGEFLADIFG